MNAPEILIDASYERYAAYVRALHRLFMEGKGESDETDALRDRMDEPWDVLTPDQQVLASGLTADLNWIRRDPPRAREERKVVPAEELPKMEAARRARDWRSVLEILRRAAPYLPRPAVAYVRAFAWEALGDGESAQLFFEHAAAGGRTVQSATMPTPRWAQRDGVHMSTLPRPAVAHP